jgi:hypothetical protein
MERHRGAPCHSVPCARQSDERAAEVGDRRFDPGIIVERERLVEAWSPDRRADDDRCCSSSGESRIGQGRRSCVARKLPNQGQQAAEHRVARTDASNSATPPPGCEQNWIKTLPDQGWSIFIRLYGPLQSYFDHTWKPDDIIRTD